MLSRITAFFSELQQSASETNDELSIEMACTVLLCEVMRADGRLDAQEQQMLASIIAKQFSLQDDEITELISKATEMSEHAIDFHQFTSKLNSHYSPKQKTAIVALLWQLALADGKIASIEEHIIRKIADLLHLSRAEYIQAKNTVYHK